MTTTIDNQSLTVQQFIAPICVNPTTTPSLPPLQGSLVQDPNVIDVLYVGNGVDFITLGSKGATGGVGPTGSTGPTGPAGIGITGSITVGDLPSFANSMGVLQDSGFSVTGTSLGSVAFAPTPGGNTPFNGTVLLQGLTVSGVVTFYLITVIVDQNLGGETGTWQTASGTIPSAFLPAGSSQPPFMPQGISNFGPGNVFYLIVDNTGTITVNMPSTTGNQTISQMNGIYV